MWVPAKSKLKELEIETNSYESDTDHIMAISVTPIQYSLE